MSKARILIVEDELVVADELRLMLEELGYRVSGICDNGEEALRQLRRNTPDLLLMDIVLRGELDGIDTAALIARESDVPVVFVTAHADPHFLSRLDSTDPFGYLLKPVRPNELRAALTVALTRAQSARELRSFERVANTFMGLCQAVIATDAQGTIKLANQAAGQLLGTDSQSLQGRRLTAGLQLSDPVSGDDTEAIVAEILRHPDRARRHRLLLTPGNAERTIPVALSSGLIRDRAGQREGLALVIEDLTESEQIRTDARRLSEQAQLILDSTPDGFIALHADGTIVDANQAYADMLGYRCETLRDTPFSRYNEQSSQHEQGIWKSVLTQGHHHFETRQRHRDGHILDLEISAKSQQTDDCSLIFAFVRDVTERCRLERRSRRRTTGLEKLDHWARILSDRVSGSERGYFVAVADTVLDLLQAEQAAVTLIDAARTELSYRAARGSASERFLNVRVPIGHAELYQALLHSGQSQRITTLEQLDSHAADPALQVNAQHALLVPLMCSGQLTGALLALRTDTAFDELDEELAQLLAQRVSVGLDNLRMLHSLEARVSQRTAELATINRELESFSYSVSHDLRGPLRSIDGFSHVLSEDYADRLDPQAMDYLARVRAASQRMGYIIDDLLDLSQMSRCPMRDEQVNLSELAQQTIAALRQRDSQRRVNVVIEPDLRAYGDPTMLRTVLENLLGNAWKFSARRADASIELRRESEHDDKTCFVVRDNGAGFDMQHAEKLFGTFERLHTLDEFEGTGIGLATVQRIIQRHGGEVWAEGRIGGGAKFYFELRQRPIDSSAT